MQADNAAKGLRCRLGWHKHGNVHIHCEDERLKFGLPYCYFTWTCPRCGYEGRTS